MPRVRVQDFLTFLSKKWLVDIVEQLRHDAKKFSELLENIDNISNKMLSDRIKELVQLQFINKIVYSLIPLNVKYELTEKGLVLVTLFEEIEKYTTLLEENEE